MVPTNLVSVEVTTDLTKHIEEMGVGDMNVTA
jgi:hypothetical protein